MTLGFATLALAAALGCGGGEQPPAGTIDLEAYWRGETQYPGSSWGVAQTPSELGWSEAALADLRSELEPLGSAALMVVHRGVVVVDWGETAARSNVQSIRKSLLSSLLGIEVAAGRLDPEATLAELGIDDTPPLTPGERQARLVHLLDSRSGIYHSALYEAGHWKRDKPTRGSHRPGDHWYYNNWDFNALGTIFERSSGEGIGAAFARRIAVPTGMQDFRPADVVYLTRSSLTERIAGNGSDHRAYVFMASARDLARYGLLYLAGGRWRGGQVVPEEWVERSLARGPGGVDGHGYWYSYLWWVHGEQSELGRRLGTRAVVARGSRGQRLVLLPERDLVVVHLVATGGVGLLPQLKRRFLGADSVADEAIEGLLEKVLAAAPA